MSCPRWDRPGSCRSSIIHPFAPSPSSLTVLSPKTILGLALKTPFCTCVRLEKLVKCHSKVCVQDSSPPHPTLGLLLPSLPESHACPALETSIDRCRDRASLFNSDKLTNPLFGLPDITTKEESWPKWKGRGWCTSLRRCLKTWW